MRRAHRTWLPGLLVVACALAGAHAGHAQTKSGGAPTAKTSAPKATTSASASAPKATTSASASAPKATTSASASAAPAASVDPTRKLFEDGTEALNAGRFAEAEQKLRAAWAQRSTYDVAGNLGATLLKLGRPVEAARFLSFAVDHFPVGGKPSVKQWVDELLAEAKKQVVTVRVKIAAEGTASADGAAVSVNGAAAGTWPLDEAVFTDAGPIVVSARKDGFDDARLELRGEKGAEVEAALVMKAKAPVVGGGEPVRWPAYAAFGVGGLGLIVGSVTGGLAAADNAKLAGACNKTTGACPENQRSTLAELNAFSYASTAAFVVAGLGAALGVTLLVLPSKTKSTPAAVVSASPGFVSVKGAF
ncbi:MAG: hypothetical protein U0441_07825 [Polyangiaceae bacterium]